MASPNPLLVTFTLFLPIEKHFLFRLLAPLDLIANAWICELRVPNGPRRLNSLQSHSVDYMLSCNERAEKDL